VLAIKDGATLDRKLRVAVIGGGPSGACCAESLAAGGVEAFLFERKMDNCKPCGGAIPICMVEEFDLPMEIIDRRVTKMKMISPSNREVDVGQTRACPIARLPLWRRLRWLCQQQQQLPGCASHAAAAAGRGSQRPAGGRQLRPILDYGWLTACCTCPLVLQ
jgi:hypothetical protein